MKTQIRVALFGALVIAMGSVIAEDTRTVTKTINVNLTPTNPTIDTSNGNDADNLEPIVGKDVNTGTRTIGDISLNSTGSISFTASGSALCEMEITSDYVDGSGRFLMASSTSDLTDSITYDLTGSLSMTGKTGTGLVAGSAFSSGSVTVNTSGWKSSIEDNDNEECSIYFNSPYARNFKTNDGSASSSIPADWTGTRTGNLVFTMRAK
ncbi:MAG: hypothetical protein R3F02_21985 [Thiolinea sp.]